MAFLLNKLSEVFIFIFDSLVCLSLWIWDILLLLLGTSALDRRYWNLGWTDSSKHTHLLDTEIFYFGSSFPHHLRRAIVSWNLRLALSELAHVLDLLSRFLHLFLNLNLTDIDALKLFLGFANFSSHLIQLLTEFLILFKLAFAL
jgi:hypothetical protein